MKKDRWIELDLFKFFGLISLLLWHTIDWWFSDGKGMIWGLENMTEYMNFFQVGMSFFLFLCISLPITAGVSIYFMHKKGKNLVIRGLLLVFYGFFVNYISFGSDDIISWDILQFIGLSTILIFLLLKFNLNNKILIGIPIGIILISKIFTNYYFQKIAVYDSPYRKLIDNIFFGDPSGESYYPLLPWFSLVIIGYLIAYYKESLNIQREKISKYSLLLSFILSPFYFISNEIWKYDVMNTWGSHIFMPTLIDFISLFPLFFLIFGLLHLISKDLVVKIYNLNFIKKLSTEILYVYVFHSIIMYIICSYLVPQYRYDNLVLFLIIIFQYCLAYLISIISKKIKQIIVRN